MVGWSGLRKSLLVALFVAPMFLGVLIFNIYPILLNIYVSFTNYNRFHPNPDCDLWLNSIMEPRCWPMFRPRLPQGLGTPFTLQQPLYQNYSELFGRLFTSRALGDLAQIALCLIPLGLVFLLHRYWERRPGQLANRGWFWGGAFLASFALAAGLNLPRAVLDLMESGDFIAVVFRTVFFVAARVPLSFLLGLVLALILNRPSLPGRTLFRVVLFLPWAASSVAILMALVWQFFFREQGTINQLLALLGIKGPIWLNHPFSAFAIVVLVDVWFSYPFFMVVILGALQSIPQELYEAAEVDGASWWDQLLHITLPLIRPAVLPATVLTSITAFQMFGTAWAITNGGPITGVGKPGATEFVMIYAYKQIYQLQNYGRAAAFAVIIFGMLFLATLYSLRLTRITKGAYE